MKTSGKGPLSLRQRMIVRNREAINNVVVHVLLHGEVQQDALARALEIFHRKTPGARIVLQEDERGHRQAVLESSSPGLAISPIPGDSNVDQLISVLLLEEIRHRFDLSSGPLYRVTMLQDSKELNHVILTVHPFIAECLAVSRMLSDILHIYREPTDVLNANLPVKLQEGDTTCDTEIQETAYALSFASWQQSLLHEGYLEPQRPYWTRALRHPLPRFEFRLKRGGKEQTGTRLSWSHTGIILPPKTLGLLHSYAAPYGADVTVLLLSCYIMLLRQLTQAEDILVGTLMNGSAQTRESGLPFIYQTLSPLRLSLQHSTSFGALLGQVKQEVEAGRSSMLYPYDLQWVNAGKIAESKETLYQVLFAEEEWLPGA
ncbi:condensation domain-containing protein [Paenibacillus rhizoplanae]